MKLIFIFATGLSALTLISARTPSGGTQCPRACPFIYLPVCAYGKLDGQLHDFPNNCTLMAENQCPQDCTAKNQFIFLWNGTCDDPEDDTDPCEIPEDPTGPIYVDPIYADPVMNAK